jgi:hypothetical protein
MAEPRVRDYDRVVRYRPRYDQRRPRRQSPPTDVVDGDWISPEQAAALLGIGERTIRRRCQAGDLRCLNWTTGWIVDRASLPSE